MKDHSKPIKLILETYKEGLTFDDYYYNHLRRRLLCDYTKELLIKLYKEGQIKQLPTDLSLSRFSSNVNQLQLYLNNRLARLEKHPAIRIILLVLGILGGIASIISLLLYFFGISPQVYYESIKNLNFSLRYSHDWVERLLEKGK